ncbi:phosphate permease [Purpureocillium lilacinum]|uniref:Phosphate permease n=2 Tax=Purpureocillium lilacinum TaxID=33203 RepID=A0A2U3EGL6_PURLI|nr:phosphate permease [Purpureocillium lilacinum]
MTEKARRLSLQDSVPGALSSRAASRTERSSSCTSAELLVLELLELRYGALVDAVDEEESARPWPPSEAETASQQASHSAVDLLPLDRASTHLDPTTWGTEIPQTTSTAKERPCCVPCEKAVPLSAMRWIRQRSTVSWHADALRERLVAVFGWILAAQGLTLSYATRPRGFALKVSWPEPTIASNRYSPHCATITDYMTPKAMSPEECSRDIGFLNGGELVFRVVFASPSSTPPPRVKTRLAPESRHGEGCAARMNEQIAEDGLCLVPERGDVKTATINQPPFAASNPRRLRHSHPCHLVIADVVCTPNQLSALSGFKELVACLMYTLRMACGENATAKCTCRCPNATPDMMLDGSTTGTSWHLGKRSDPLCCPPSWMIRETRRHLNLSGLYRPFLALTLLVVVSFPSYTSPSSTDLLKRTSLRSRLRLSCPSISGKLRAWLKRRVIGFVTMALHQYDFLLAVGTIFAFLDAWNIGANDVANSWASSVSSRSITYLQAMLGASVMEFSGALGVGGRVADTIRTKVVDTTAFNDEPALLMLGMVCAVIASASYLTMATRLGMPVSTTHSILGGVLGMGVAALGGDGITWVGYKNGKVDLKQGVVQVFMAWIISPVMAGAFGACIFLLTKYGVLLRSNPTMKGLMLVPIYFWLTASLIVMLLIWKGGDYEVNLTDAQIPGVIVAVGAGWGLLMALFLVPWMYRIVVKEDWQLKAWHILQGPFLLRRGEVPPPPADFKGVVRNFYEGHLTREELDARRARTAAAATNDIEGQHEKTATGSETPAPGPEDSAPTHKSLVGPKPDAPWHTRAYMWWFMKWLVLRGVDQDIVSSQKDKSVIAGDVEEIHAHAKHYDNRTEFLYTFLQIMTASAASFTHGANDVANAVGPYASIFQIWQSGAVPLKGANVPLWILAFGGVGIVIGLWTYGYHIMRNLGNRVTLMSPARGFSMELGSVITVIVATRLELPVSTTQCITGAIVGVGLCNGDWRAINWRMVAWIYLGWFITVPVAGLISGILMGFIINCPRW